MTDTPGTPTLAGQTIRHLGAARTPGTDVQSFDRTCDIQDVFSRERWVDDSRTGRRRRNAEVQSLALTRRVKLRMTQNVHDLFSQEIAKI